MANVRSLREYTVPTGMKPLLSTLPQKPAIILGLGLAGSLASFALGLTLGFRKYPSPATAQPLEIAALIFGIILVIKKSLQRKDKDQSD